MANLDSMLKSRDIILPTKVHIVKAIVFPVVMYGHESWAIKKAEHWRTDAFELWCWRRLLRVPWTARRSNQSILKKISPEHSLERLMLKVQYFGYLLQRADSLQNTLTLGKIESRRRKGQQRMRFLDGIRVNTREFEQTPEDSEGQGSPGVLQFTGLQRVRQDWATEQRQQPIHHTLYVYDPKCLQRYFELCHHYFIWRSEEVKPQKGM